MNYTISIDNKNLYFDSFVFSDSIEFLVPSLTFESNSGVKFEYSMDSIVRFSINDSLAYTGLISKIRTSGEKIQVETKSLTKKLLNTYFKLDDVKTFYTEVGVNEIVKKICDTAEIEFKESSIDLSIKDLILNEKATCFYNLNHILFLNSLIAITNAFGGLEILDDTFTKDVFKLGVGDAILTENFETNYSSFMLYKKNQDMVSYEIMNNEDNGYNNFLIENPAFKKDFFNKKALSYKVFSIFYDYKTLDWGASHYTV